MLTFTIISANISSRKEKRENILEKLSIANFVSIATYIT